MLIIFPVPDCNTDKFPVFRNSIFSGKVFDENRMLFQENTLQMLCGKTKDLTEKIISLGRDNPEKAYS